MSVLTLAGKPINWLKPPKATTRVMWSRRDMYERKVTGSFRTIAALDRLDGLAVKKYGKHIVVIQPSYNTGVKASAGTHDYDACLDVYIPGVAWAEQEKFFRANGAGAYWRRPPLFGNHIHLFILPPIEGKDRRDDFEVHGFKVGYLVPGQLVDYFAHRNALANHAADHGWFPSNIAATIFNLPAYIKTQIPKPTKPVDPWFNISFLNTHGDDGAEGTRSFNSRVPAMVKTSVEGKPAFVTYCEVRKDGQIDALTEAMIKEGYALTGYDHRLAVFHRPHVKIGGYSFAQYKTQNKGAIEGMLRVKFSINGSKGQIGVTHLDYRPGFDQGRVDQMKEGIASLARYGLAWSGLTWKKRTTIVGDFNSEDWVMDKAVIPAGFVDAGCGANIDFVAVGAGRPIRGASKTSTASDHPRILARLGRY